MSEDQSNLCRLQCTRCIPPSSARLRNPSTSRQTWKRAQCADAAEPCRQSCTNYVEHHCADAHWVRVSTCSGERCCASVCWYGCGCGCENVNYVDSSHKPPILQRQQRTIRRYCQTSASLVWPAEVALGEARLPHRRRRLQRRVGGSCCRWQRY
jgi:hypothetical protein